MRSVARRPLLGLAAVALVAGLSGCGGKPKYTVKGTVNYNGAPLAKPDGQIVFVGADGTQTTAPISPENGSYTVSDVPAGPNRVVINYKNPSFKPIGRPKGSSERKKSRPPAASPSLIPDKYADPETSGLTVDVQEGTVFNADLSGPKIP